jgi:hypothetical protein
LLWRLLLRLAAAAVVTLLPPQKSLPHRQPLHLIPQVGVSNQNFTVGFLLELYLFFPAIAGYPQLSALFRLLCMTRHSCRNVIPVRCESLLWWQLNRSKGMMWLLYKIPAIRGCPRRCY